MTMTKINSKELALKIINEEDLSVRVSIEVFRDIYNQIQGAEKSNIIKWIIIFIGERVLVQPILHPNISIEIQETKPRFYIKNDFDFIDTENVLLFGTYKGKYKFFEFLIDILSWKGIICFGSLLFITCMLIHYFVDATSGQQLSISLMQAMSIFIAMFVLFVLTINVEDFYSFAESNRLHCLFQSDKYIGYIGIITLIFCIISSTIINNSDKVLTILQILCLSCSISGTLLSFWLILNYQFNRRAEMNELLMAKTLLKKQQKLAKDYYDISKCQHIIH